MDKLSQEENELIDRLKWFVKIRYLVALALGIFAIAIRYYAKIQFDVRSVLYVAFFISIYNLALNFGNISLSNIQDAGRRVSISKILAYLQSFADIIAITVVLYFTGTIENPFAFFYIFQLIFAAILLSPKASIFETVFSLTVFTLLVFGEFYGFLPHRHLKGFIPVELFNNIRYVTGILLALYLTVIFSVIISYKLFSDLKRHEDEIVKLSNELEDRAISCEIAYDKLDNLSVEKAKYVRKISHELKSPLSAIQTTAQTLIEGYAGDIPVTQKKLLETIVRRTKSMSNLVIDMLSLSKVAESLPHKVPEQVDFREILLEEIKSLEPIIKKKNLKLNESFVEVPKIWAFKEEIAELVKNLTENAIKYTPENENVSLVLNSQKKAIRLVVSDSGIGIEPKDLPHLFEQFFRGETAKKIDKEGTGLGLAIVKTIVEKHKGKIEVLSKPGKGSTFTVIIPLKTRSERT